jgi:hypothetical protein
MLSQNDRFQLNKMLEQHKVEDKTDQIRDQKHSGEIKKNVEIILKIKNENPTLSKKELEEIILPQCSFLFYNYLELYNILFKEINTTIVYKLLNVLEGIEQGTYDQHEGSVVVGTLLKEIYIDSRLSETKYEEKEMMKPKDIHWKDYKKNNIILEL